MRQVFSVAATKGWAWSKHNIADLVERTVALRNLLLVESGCLEIPNGMAGRDSLDDKHIQQISFRQCITFCQHGSWKAGSPASNPLLLKLNLDNCSLVCIGHLAQLRAQSLHCNKSWDHNSMTKPSASLHETGFFSEDATKGWAWCKQNADLVKPTVALRNLLLVGSGCLEFQKGNVLNVFGFVWCSFSVSFFSFLRNLVHLPSFKAIRNSVTDTDTCSFRSGAKISL